MIRQAFLYGYNVDQSNSLFYFREAGDTADRIFGLTYGTYTASELALAIQIELDGAGDNSYTVTFDKSKRMFTIAADAVFDLMITTATFSIFNLIGFTADESGFDEYTGAETGSLFKPQLPFYSWTRFEDNIKAVNGAVSVSTAGIMKATTLGQLQYMSFDIRFINDKENKHSPVEYNPNAVNEARAFMNAAIKKEAMEFFPNRDDLTTSHKCVLNKTGQDRNGLGYTLKEMININMPKFYQLNGLEFLKQ